MSEKLLVTVVPVNNPAMEFEVWDDDWPDKEALAAHARERWVNHAAVELQLSVAIERAEWKDSGRYGSGEQEQEAEMIRRAFEEAERE